MIKRWLLVILLISGSAFSQQMITKVIELNYLQADKVIQLIQPLLQTDEKVSGSGQTLIVNVSPQTLTQIRNVLHKIDVPPVVF
ncbi:type II/III secretion system protein, partial [Salmonella enterica subsp. enterica serovar Agona]